MAKPIFSVPGWSHNNLVKNCFHCLSFLLKHVSLFLKHDFSFFYDLLSLKDHYKHVTMEDYRKLIQSRWKGDSKCHHNGLDVWSHEFSSNNVLMIIKTNTSAKTAEKEICSCCYVIQLQIWHSRNSLHNAPINWAHTHTPSNLNMPWKINGIALH